MTMVLLAFALVPGSALLAGFIVWSIHRNQSPGDGELVTVFAGAMLSCLAVSIYIGKTDTVRRRLDPQYRIPQDIEANPVYAALRRTSESTHRKLAEHVSLSLAQGATVEEAFERARPLLTSLATDELVFASWSAMVHWGALTRDSLAALQSIDPAECVRAMRRQPIHIATQRRAFNTDNARAFQSAVVEVFDTAALGKARDYSSPKTPVDFNTAVRRFREIGEHIALRYGEVPVEEAKKKQLPTEVKTPANELCTARIALLDEILKEPEPMAGFLVDGLLR
jgi:hypothetical protein